MAVTGAGAFANVGEQGSYGRPAVPPPLPQPTMSAVDWGSDHTEPPKRRSYTPWIIGCLGGCMFFLGATAVALYFGGSQVKRWFQDLSKPDVQWPKLAEVLPYEQRPEDYRIFKWPFQDLWQLEARREDLVMFVLAWPEDGVGATPGELVSDPAKTPMFQMMHGAFETKETTVTLQGRELHGARVHRTEETAEEGDPDESAGDEHGWSGGDAEFLQRLQSIRGEGLGLDVTAEGSKRHVLVWLLRRGEGGVITDEDARSVLSPFLIGPDRR